MLLILRLKPMVKFPKIAEELQDFNMIFQQMVMILQEHFYNSSCFKKHHFFDLTTGKKLQLNAVTLKTLSITEF